MLQHILKQTFFYCIANQNRTHLIQLCIQLIILHVVAFKNSNFINKSSNISSEDSI